MSAPQQRSFFPVGDEGDDGHGLVCGGLLAARRVGVLAGQLVYRWECPLCAYVGEPFIVPPRRGPPARPRPGPANPPARPSGRPV
jgi:hypothetical protein